MMSPSNVHGELSNECCASHGDTGASVTQSLDETFFTSRQSLHHAVIENNVPHARHLLQARPGRVDELDSSGYTPLLYAKSQEMIRLFVAAGADMYAVSPGGNKTLLHRLVLTNNLDGIRTCMSGFKVRDKIRDADGNLAVDLARAKEYRHVAQVIIMQSSQS